MILRLPGVSPLTDELGRHGDLFFLDVLYRGLSITSHKLLPLTAFFFESDYCAEAAVPKLFITKLSISRRSGSDLGLTRPHHVEP